MGMLNTVVGSRVSKILRLHVVASLMIGSVGSAQSDKEPFDEISDADLLTACRQFDLSEKDSSDLFDLTPIRMNLRMTIYPAVQSNQADIIEMVTGRFVGVIRNYGTDSYADWKLPARVNETTPGITCIFMGTKPNKNERRAVLVSTLGRVKVKAEYEPRTFEQVEVPWERPHASWTSHRVNQKTFINSLDILLEQARRASGADLERIREAVLAIVGDQGPWISCTTSGCCKIGNAPS